MTLYIKDISKQKKEEDSLNNNNKIIECERNNTDSLKSKQKENKKEVNILMFNSSDQNTKRSFKLFDSYSKILKNNKDFNIGKILKTEKKNDIEILEQNNGFTESDMRKFVSKSLDDLSFYKVLKKDKRSFSVFLKNSIFKKNMIFRTFFLYEETKPIYLKIIFFTLYLCLYFFVIALLHTPNEINRLYNQKTYEYNISTILSLIFTSYTISKVLIFFVGLFLIDKNDIIEMIKLEKEEKDALILATQKLIKKAKIKYIIFIILNILLTIICWYYICTFNFSYPNTKFHWFILCLIVLVAEPIITAFLSFVETCLRFLSIKLKIKLIFTLSQYLKTVN